MAEPIRLQDLFYGRGVTVSRDGAKKNGERFFLFTLFTSSVNMKECDHVYTPGACALCVIAMLAPPAAELKFFFAYMMMLGRHDL